METYTICSMFSQTKRLSRFVHSFTEISSSYVIVETYRKTVSSSANRKINQWVIDYKNQHDFFIREQNTERYEMKTFHQLMMSVSINYALHSFITFVWICADLPKCVCIFGTLYSFHSFRVTIWTTSGSPYIKFPLNDVVNIKDDDFCYFSFNKIITQWVFSFCSFKQLNLQHFQRFLIISAKYKWIIHLCIFLQIMFTMRTKPDTRLKFNSKLS